MSNLEVLHRLVIGPLVVLVKHDPDLEEDGEWDASDHVIRLRRRKDPLTILHEALHAISDLYGLQLSEGRVRVLEMTLGDLLERNGWLGKALASQGGPREPQEAPKPGVDGPKRADRGG